MKPELRREQILKVAAQVFARKGYHATSVSDIIEAAGIARGTFYLYFESKRLIFEELVDGFAARIRVCLKRLDLAEGQPPWQEQLRSNITQLTALVREEPELTQVLYDQPIGLDEDFDTKLRGFYKELTEAVEGAFSLGKEMGLIRPDIDPRIAALHLIGSAKEVLYYVSSQGLSGSEVEGLVDEVMSYTIEGLFIKDAQGGAGPKEG